MEGLITNIQRFCVHDGPGIRTTVFFKGCNLRCFWCHNPETLCKYLELQVFPQNCIRCGKCVVICPNKAHQIEDGQKRFKREMCKTCGKCVEICNALALTMSGKILSVKEVVKEITRDIPFYINSGGGVTFSGGEPLLQELFLTELLVESKRHGINTAVDTAGNVSWKVFERILPYVDLFLYDLKIVDAKKHKKATGVENHLILHNLRKLVKIKAGIYIRIPIIPGINDNGEEVERMINFLKELDNINRIIRIELLPFHRLSEKKYESLGLDYKAKEIIPPTDENILELKNQFKNAGLRVEG